MPNDPSGKTSGPDPEIRAIWEQTNAAHLYEMAPEFTIRETADGWEVSQRTGKSVWPVTVYPYKEDAVARVMQLLDIAGPMWPQTWPERVEIGNGR